MVLVSNPYLEESQIGGHLGSRRQLHSAAKVVS